MSLGVRAYAEDRLKRINEAYAVLGDPAKRAQYDALITRRDRQAEVWEDDEEPLRPRRTQRAPSERAAPKAGHDEWKQQGGPQPKPPRERERARRAEQERRETEEHVRRQAADQFPKLRAEQDQLILYFAPGEW